MQLDLFREADDPAPQAKLWESLDGEERAAVLTVLARLMAKIVAPEEEDDE